MTDTTTHPMALNLVVDDSADSILSLTISRIL